MKTVYYSRVSSSSQNNARQVEKFKRIGLNQKDDLFMDICSGSIPFKKRPEAIRLWDLSTSYSDEVKIVVDSIDRLGRNFKDILNTVEDFTELRVNIQFLKEGFETLDPNGKVNQYGKIILAVMGSIAEAERERIRERQAEGIAVAKNKGIYIENGKKKKGYVEPMDKFLSKHKDIVTKLNAGLNYRDIAKVTGKSTSTIAKVVKKLKERETDKQHIIERIRLKQDLKAS